MEEGGSRMDRPGEFGVGSELRELVAPYFLRSSANAVRCRSSEFRVSRRHPGGLRAKSSS